MESVKVSQSSHRGIALVTVLILTAVGLLVGVGSLLLFKFQCQQRIDRQHELEKIYAVRSALNYIRLNSGQIKEVGTPLRYYTGSDRDLGLLVKPVDIIFPNVTNVSHLIMEKEMAGRNFVQGIKDQYSSTPDYEYGKLSNAVVVAATGISGGKPQNTTKYGLIFQELSVSNNVKWWVNVGMKDTGGWLQEDYGRRYFFHPYDFVPGVSTQDVMRLCLIRNVTNKLNAVGCRHGWPLSNKERALVFEVSPLMGDVNNNAVMTLSEQWVTGSRTLIRLNNCPSLCYMGMQLAEKMVSIFYVNNAGAGDVKTHGYSFSETVEMSEDTYRWFRDGLHTNMLTGKVEAPDLRAVIEVEAASDKRGKETIDAAQLDFVSCLQVTPAYQYDVYLEHPSQVTNRATVAQLIGVYDQVKRNAAYSILTYDTHGTEHKGFRRDEREAERKKVR